MSWASEQARVADAPGREEAAGLATDGFLFSPHCGP